MTLNDVVKRVKDKSHKGDPNVTSDEVTAQIIRAVEDARRELVRYLPKHFLRKDATSPIVWNFGSSVIQPLASDVMDLMIIRYTFLNVEYVLKRVESEREYYLTLFIRSQSVNRPFFYVEKGLDASGNKQIEIYPPCDTNGPYNLNYTYYKDPTRTTLTTGDLGTEFPDFPSYMQDAAWKGALFHFLKNFDDVAMLAGSKQEYEEGKQQLDDIEDSDQDLELQMRWGFGKLNFRDPTTGIRLI